MKTARPNPTPAWHLFGADLPKQRSAGFQTCCVADFQVGSPALQPAGLETRDTADLEVCATLNRYPASRAAFTLIEVMVATTLFFMAMFALLGVLSAGVHAASILRSNGPTPGMIAAQFYVTNTIEEGVVSGDFSDVAGYDKYTWRSLATEVDTNGLYEMQIVVNDPNGKPFSHLTFLLYKTASSGQRLGLQHP